MPKYIVEVQGYYFEWSTIVDAPTTFGMSLDEFKEYYREEYGRQGMDTLEDRLCRVRAKGTSARLATTPESLASLNRAGPDESNLTLDEIYRAYCLRKPVDGWLVPTVYTYR